MARTPPNELDAEAAVISTMLLSASDIDRVTAHGFLPAHCYADANRFIAEGILELHQSSGAVDVVTLSAWLRARDLLAKCGGNAYLAQLADATPSVANVLDHATLVTEAWRLRQVMDVMQAAITIGYDKVESVQAYLEETEVKIAEIAHAGRRIELEPVGDILGREVTDLAQRRESGQETATIKTGFVELDRMTGGLFRGNLYIVAGRPGMGKSAAALSLLANISRPTLTVERTWDPGYASLFFSLEMPRKQMSGRLAVHESGISIMDFLSGTIKERDWPKLLDAAETLRPWPLYVDDTPTLGLAELRAVIRLFKRRTLTGSLDKPSRGLGAVVVDYLQLMTGVRPKGSSREEEIAGLARGLKRIAKEEDIPLIVLSQLNRNVEKNTKDKRPQLSDLRESGAIEQDADQVIFLYRDRYYDKSSPTKGKAEFIVAKQRNGPTGTVEVFYDEERMRFYNSQHQDWSGDDEPHWDNG
jgi:replicative DNA helicase